MVVALAVAAVVGRFSDVVTAFKVGWNERDRDSTGWSISIGL